MTLNLTSTSQMPRSILDNLKVRASVFRENQCLEHILTNYDIRQIAEQLNDVCLDQGVIGYHYTRTIRTNIQQLGLLARSGKERREEFLLEHGHRFTPTQRNEIKNAWAAYFNQRQMPRETNVFSSI